jgi:hypothetical protein
VKSKLDGSESAVARMIEGFGEMSHLEDMVLEDIQSISRWGIVDMSDVPKT